MPALRTRKHQSFAPGQMTRPAGRAHRRRRPSEGCQGGFTLVEIMVALGILALVLVPLMAGFDWSMGQASQTNELTAATNIARQALETARETTASGTFPVPAQARAAVSGTPYQLQTSVSTNGTMNFETITATVYLGGGTAPEVSLTTVVGP